MTRKLYLVAVAMMMAVSLSAQHAYTLEECVAIAQKNNLDMRQQHLNEANRQLAYEQARHNLLPNLNASVGQNFVFGRSIGLDNTYQNTNSSQTSLGINSSVIVFDGLRMKHNIDARKADLLAAKADLRQMEDEIESAVTQAFMQVLLNKELLLLATEQQDLTKQSIAHRQELIASGRMAQGELYELEAQAAKEEQNSVQARNQLKLSLLDLALIMEVDDLESVDVVSPSAETLIAQQKLLPSAWVYDQAVQNRPELEASRHRTESAQKELLMAKAQQYPTISLGANLGTGYYKMSGRPNDSFSNQLRNNMSNAIGVSVQIPIFNRFQVKNAISQANLMVENSQLEMQRTSRQLRKKVEQAYQNAEAANSRWMAAQQSVRASQEAYRFADEKFKSGRATSYELFQAKNQLSQVLGEEAQAKYEYAFRLKMLQLLSH